MLLCHRRLKFAVVCCLPIRYFTYCRLYYDFSSMCVCVFVCASGATQAVHIVLPIKWNILYYTTFTPSKRQTESASHAYICCCAPCTHHNFIWFCVCLSYATSTFAARNHAGCCGEHSIVFVSLFFRSAHTASVRNPLLFCRYIFMWFDLRVTRNMDCRAFISALEKIHSCHENLFRVAETFQEFFFAGILSFSRDNHLAGASRLSQKGNVCVCECEIERRRKEETTVLTKATSWIDEVIRLCV